MTGGTKLREIQVVVQDLAGVVEYGAGGRLADNLFQDKGFVFRAGDKFVEVIDVGLEVLAVVEAQGLCADDGLERVLRVG